MIHRLLCGESSEVHSHKYNITQPFWLTGLGSGLELQPTCFAALQVLATPRVRGSRMLINPTLAKQHARRVCVVGVPLLRHVLARSTAVDGQAAAAGSSSSNNSTTNRVSLSPAAIKQAMADCAARDPSYQQFLELRENRGLPRHLGTLLQLLSVNDDPLTVAADIITSRWFCWVLKGRCWLMLGHFGSCCPPRHDARTAANTPHPKLTCLLCVEMTASHLLEG
jgi:hypothetical protein